MGRVKAALMRRSLLHAGRWTRAVRCMKVLLLIRWLLAITGGMVDLVALHGEPGEAPAATRLPWEVGVHWCGGVGKVTLGLGTGEGPGRFWPSVV